MRVLLCWVVAILAQRPYGDQVASAHADSVALAPADLALLREGALGARLEADPAPAEGHAAWAASVRRAAADGWEALHDAGARHGRTRDRRFDGDHRRAGGALPGASAVSGR